MTRTIEQRLVDYATALDAAVNERSSGNAVSSLERLAPASTRRDESPARRRIAAMAAAAAVVLIAFVAVVLAADDRDVVRTDPAAEPSVEPIDPADAPGFFSQQGTADEVVATYLSNRLDVPVSSLKIERLEPEQGQSPTLVGFGWTFSSSAPGGTVVLRAGPDDWWDVIEAFSDGLSVDSLSRADGSLTVAYSGPSGATMHLILQDIGDNILHETECSDTSCSFLREVPDVPVIVRLQLLDDAGRPITLEERRIDPRPGSEAVTTSTTPTPTTAIGP